MRFGETARRAGGVHQTSDDGGTIDVLQSVVVQPASPSHTQRIDRLRALSHQTLDVLSDREIIIDAYAQHLQTTAARYSRRRCRFSSDRSMVSPSPVVSEDDLGRLVAVQLEVVSRSPFLHVGELRCRVVSLLAGMMMYVSSAYLQKCSENRKLWNSTVREYS